MKTQGWAKFTDDITSGKIPCHKPTPTLAMFHVEFILSTCSGIEDSRNPILIATFLFLQDILGPNDSRNE